MRPEAGSFIEVSAKPHQAEPGSRSAPTDHFLNAFARLHPHAVVEAAEPLPRTPVQGVRNPGALYHVRFRATANDSPQVADYRWQNSDDRENLLLSEFARLHPNSVVEHLDHVTEIHTGSELYLIRFHPNAATSEITYPHPLAE